jgi:hypothetical protein
MGRHISQAQQAAQQNCGREHLVDAPRDRKQRRYGDLQQRETMFAHILHIPHEIDQGMDGDQQQQREQGPQDHGLTQVAVQQHHAPEFLTRRRPGPHRQP